ncbi:flagellar biosynthetic protein FliO [Pseudomonadota bacterium]
MKHILTTFFLMLPASLVAKELEGEAPARLAELPLDSGHLANTAVALIFVLALIVGLAWFLRRFGGLPNVGKGVVTIVGGVSLGTRERAVLLQVGETRLLVGVSPGRVQTLHVLSQEEWNASNNDNNKFEQQLDIALKEKQV